MRPISYNNEQNGHYKMTPPSAAASDKTGRTASYFRHNALIERTIAVLALLLFGGAALAAAPVASNVSIDSAGLPINVGVQLTGSYDYNDGDGNAELGTTYQWYRNGAPILFANGQTYTLVNTDLGALIVFEVTPRDGTAEVGSPAPSSAVGPVGANEAPVASAVSISGTNTLGSTLNGSYSYSDAEGDAEGTPVLQWLRDGAPIPLANGSSYTCLLYTSDAADDSVYV